MSTRQITEHHREAASAAAGRRLLTLVERDGNPRRINHGVSGAVACPPRSVEEAQVGTSEDQQIERGVAGLNCACNPQMTPTEGD